MNKQPKTVAFLMNTPPMPFIEVGQYNGYVSVRPDHPLSGKPYDCPEVEALEVHGGITYAGRVGDLPLNERLAECLDYNKELSEHWWVFGFDTCHYGDNPDKWNRDAVAAETRRLQEQLAEMMPRKQKKRQL